MSKKRITALVAVTAGALTVGLLGLSQATAQQTTAHNPTASRDSPGKSDFCPDCVNKGPINPRTWQYGTRNDPPAAWGCTRFDCPIDHTWNPVKRKVLEGKSHPLDDKAFHIYGGTVNAGGVDGIPDGTTNQYCSIANAVKSDGKTPEFDFTWTEVQHAPASWETIAKWYTAPECHNLTGTTWNGFAVPGSRVAPFEDARTALQHVEDEGAMVVVVPQVEDVEQARAAVDYTYYPPIGHRSLGGIPDAYSGANAPPGGYRNTFNQNVVLIVMIESVNAAKNAADIAKVPGVDGLFAASSDLGSNSGYAQGDPDYNKLVQAVHDAAVNAGILLCGPVSWEEPPPTLKLNGNDAQDFNCFQGGEQN